MRLSDFIRDLDGYEKGLLSEVGRTDFADMTSEQMETEIKNPAAVQQLVDLGDIRHGGCRAHHAVYQPRFIINADVRLHAKVILVPLLGLVHFRVALAVLVLG